MFEIVKRVGEKTNICYDNEYLKRIKHVEPLKNIEDPVKRREQLKDAFDVRDEQYKCKYVLLMDDVYRSGSTLIEATNTLLIKGKISKVYVLAITRTRTKR